MSKKEENNLALYRKYRPETFADVVGQEQIVSVIQKSLKDGSVSHAYLFTGSRGTGKTTVARIIARELGTSANDVYEIDAASNRGIDDIRELRENVRTLPFDSKYKVYIVDEVHMLTKEAFNALLKTLEEPPAHVIFILATTELEKVPDTIVSRCQTYSFKKPTETILAKQIEKVGKEEGYSVDHDAAEIIALLGDGSFRDTLGVLQKVLGHADGKKVDAELVARITNAPRGELINGMIQAIADKDPEKALILIRQAGEESTDMLVLYKLLLMKFRLALILRYAPNEAEIFADQISERDLAFIKELVATKPATITSGSLEILLSMYHMQKNAVIPTLPLELSILKILG